MTMDVLIHKFMNVIFPAILFILLCIAFPPYLLVKFLYYNLVRPFILEDMTGKVVLITGASSGIGEQIVYEYARRGACLVLVARRKKLLEIVKEKACELGSPDVLVVCADITKVEDCKRFIDEAVNHFGRLDHLVNNAGIISLCPFEGVSNILNVAPVMDVNFWGAVYATYAAIPHLRKSKGRIVVIASPIVWVLGPRLSFYAASKAAVTIFFESLRAELDPDVSVSIAFPGVIKTEMTKGNHLGKEGVMEVDEESMSLFIGNFPVISAELCAKSIVEGVCRGDRTIAEPYCFKIAHYWNVLCPEITHWFFWWLNAIKPYKRMPTSGST
ncbi:hypothetical protein MKW92_012088 [Papaver armeniacum]|nr:hypothetical protein MKW92_012088 [Papaver armeniacum]